MDGKYALYTRPQEGFIDAGAGGMGIGWALVDSMENAEIRDERIIDTRYYHTIKEVKNGEGPHPLKTSKGWLHLAHGVRGCSAGLRYVLYMYMTALDDPTHVIAAPAGYTLAPVGEERVGDVSNVLFSNGWVADDDGRVLLYYASSDTRMHVAESTVDKLIDYCMNTSPDGLTTSASVGPLDRMLALGQDHRRQPSVHHGRGQMMLPDNHMKLLTNTMNVMKKIRSCLFFILFGAASVLLSCGQEKRDTEELVDPWLRERTPVGFRLESQIGAATITQDWRHDDQGSVYVQLVTGSLDMSAVKVVSIDFAYPESEYCPTASIGKGSVLDLSDGTAEFTVTAYNGETRTYTVTYRQLPVQRPA